MTGRLNKHDRAEILAAHRAGVSVEQLAQEYRRTVVTVRRIIKKAKEEERCTRGGR